MKQEELRGVLEKRENEDKGQKIEKDGVGGKPPGWLGLRALSAKGQGSSAHLEPSIKKCISLGYSTEEHLMKNLLYLLLPPLATPLLQWKK